MIKIGVIVGSVRDLRVGRTVADWAFEGLPKSNEVEYELIDLKDWDLPMVHEEYLPGMQKYQSESIKKWSEKISSFDGYIFVTPEYNNGYPASLKNALDSIYIEWQRKPAGIVGYGWYGGTRAAEQLATVLSKIGMVPLTSTTASVIDIGMAIEDGKVKPESTRGSLEKLAENLLWWASALKNAKNT